jgi:tripartite-type tricarboxylate transporter receptor subunit TctC
MEGKSMGPIILQRIENASATNHPRFNENSKSRRPATRVTGNMFHLLLVAALVLLCVSPVQAQRGAYPSATVKIIVGFPPGGGVDVVARLVGQKLAVLWGQTVLVDNRPGASTSIATRFVADSVPDGHTILINSSSMTINQVANPNAGYDVERQLIPVLNAAWQPLIVAAAPDLPVSSLRDIFSLSKTRKLSYGSPGQASIGHLAGAYLFDLLAKAEVLHIPYKGAAPALTDLAGKQTELAVVTLPPAVPLVKSGKIKAIAVTSAKRASSLPNIPTVAESGFPGYDVNTFTGFFLPAGTPRAVVETFREAVLKVLAMADIKEKLTNLGFEQADTAKENFPRIVSDELKQWTKVIKEANIKAE